MLPESDASARTSGISRATSAGLSITSAAHQAITALRSA